MLSRARGLDVVVGFVETYGRRDTEAQLRSRGHSQRARSSTAASTMEEMDVDAIIARQPQVCVVDELAHTNVPGSRHHKRYEDVIDLLARHPCDDRREHPAPGDAERRGCASDWRARARDGARHVS